MLNNRVEFCKKDFQMYKDFQKNIDICNQRMAELKDKYTNVESIQDDKKDTRYATIRIGTTMLTLYLCCKC